MNQEELVRQQVNSEIEAVIQSMDLSLRMQDTVPDVLDITNETEATLESYGVGRSSTVIGPKRANQFSLRCLWARRLVEAGVRSVACCVINGVEQELRNVRLI